MTYTTNELNYRVSEKTNFSSEKVSIKTQKLELRSQNEALVKQNEALEKSQKIHQSVVVKLQRKLKLVQSEKDAQRQLLDSYEKDLRVTQDASAKQYKILRKDLESLRIENEKLRKRKSELEIKIENIRSNVLNDEKFKVVHFKNNPAAIAQEQASNEVAKLRAKIERLKLRNRKLEEGNEDLTMRSNETMNMTLNIKDLQKLREEHKTLQSKYQESEKIFKNINQELREVVYMLFGYKLDRYGNSNYRYERLRICEMEHSFHIIFSFSSFFSRLKQNHFNVCR